MLCPLAHDLQPHDATGSLIPLQSVNAALPMSQMPHGLWRVTTI